MKNYEIDPNVTDAIKDLLKIMEIEGDGFKSGKLRRTQALNWWLDRYLVEVETDQRILSKKYLDTDTEDMLKYHLATILAEELHDKDCVITTCEEKRIKTKVFALKRN